MNLSVTEKRPITKIRCLDDLLETIDYLSVPHSDGRHISLYAPGGEPAYDTAQCRIHFSDAISTACDTLRAGGVAEEEIGSTMFAATSIAEDERFWRQHRGGLACFLSDRHNAMIAAAIELPVRGVVSSRFWLRPLLAATAKADAFYALAISQKSAMLFRGSDLGIRVVECPGLPDGCDPARESGPLGHAAGKAGKAGNNPRTRNEHLKEYLRVIDSAVAAQIGHSGLPLIPACVEPYAALYREVSSYPDLREAAVAGNPDQLGEEDLRQRCLQILTEKSDAYEDRLAKQLDRLGAPAETHISGLLPVLHAAHRARVAVLILPSERERWGTFDPLDGSLTDAGATALDSNDLFELAARKTLDAGGEVCFASADELPRGQPAAMLRLRRAASAN